MKSPTTSLVIPTYNEGKNLPALFGNSGLHQVLEKDIITNLIIVDDGSEDETQKLVHKYFNKYPGIRKKSKLITHEKNLGKGAAIVHGQEEGICNKDNLTMLLDADLVRTPKGLIELAIKTARSNSTDMLTISAYAVDRVYLPMNGDGKIQTVRSKVPDIYSGQRIFTTSSIKKIFEHQNIKQILHDARRGLETGFNLLYQEKFVFSPQNSGLYFGPCGKHTNTGAQLHYMQETNDAIKKEIKQNNTLPIQSND